MCLIVHLDNQENQGFKKFCTKQRNSGCFLLCGVMCYTFQSLLPSKLDCQVQTLVIEEKKAWVLQSYTGQISTKIAIHCYFSTFKNSSITDFNKKSPTICIL